MPRPPLPPILALLLSLGAGAALAADGPSFACAKVSSPVERAICASPDLSARDRAMAAGYAKAQAALSEEGRAALRTGQRQWLRLVRLACDTSRKPKDSDPAEQQERCLTEHYESRQKQLDGAVESRNGLTFRRVDRFGVYPAGKDAEPGDDPGTLEISYPQIEAPATPALRTWNQTIAARFETIANKDGAGEDNITRSEIGFVSPRLISLAVSAYTYPHGAAHGTSSLSHLHWLLDAGRELRADDLFDRAQDKAWRKTIVSFCVKDLKTRDGSWVKNEKDLGTTPVEPRSWSFGAEGLTIHFDPYEVASYADGPQEVVVPWALLRGFLLRTAPVGS